MKHSRPDKFVRKPAKAYPANLSFLKERAEGQPRTEERQDRREEEKNKEEGMDIDWRFRQQEDSLRVQEVQEFLVNQNEPSLSG
jgi:hypothetical protein